MNCISMAFVSGRHRSHRKKSGSAVVAAGIAVIVAIAGGLLVISQFLAKSRCTGQATRRRGWSDALAPTTWSLRRHERPLPSRTSLGGPVSSRIDQTYRDARQLLDLHRPSPGCHRCDQARCAHESWLCAAVTTARRVMATYGDSPARPLAAPTAPERAATARLWLLATPASQVPPPAPPGAEPLPVAQVAQPVPTTTEEKEREARMLVSDLLEIGMIQRKAYEDAQRQAATKDSDQQPMTPEPDSAEGAPPPAPPAPAPNP